MGWRLSPGLPRSSATVGLYRLQVLQGLSEAAQAAGSLSTPTTKVRRRFGNTVLGCQVLRATSRPPRQHPKAPQAALFSTSGTFSIMNAAGSTVHDGCESDRQLVPPLAVPARKSVHGGEPDEVEPPAPGWARTVATTLSTC